MVERPWFLVVVALSVGCGATDGPPPHAAAEGTPSLPGTSATLAPSTAPAACLLEGPEATEATSGAQVVDLARDPQGRRLVVASDVAWLWGTDGEVATVPVPPTVSAGALADEHLVLAADDGWIEGWDAAGASLRWTVQVPIPDDEWSYVTDVVVDASGRVARSTSEYAGEVVVVAPGDDGVATVSEPLASYLWNVQALRFVDDGLLVVAGDWYGVPWAELWDVHDLAAPEVVTTWAPDIHDPGDVPAAATVLATALSDDGRLWLVGGTGPHGLPGPGFVGAVDVAARGDTLWTDATTADDPLGAVAVGDGLITVDAGGALKLWGADLSSEPALSLERPSVGLVAVGEELWVGGDGLHTLACP